MKTRYEQPILYLMTRSELSRGAMILYVPENVTVEDVAHMEELLKMQILSYRKAAEKREASSSGDLNE